MIATGLIARLRLDPSELLPHPDFLLIVEPALPLIEAARTLQVEMFYSTPLSG